MIKRNRRKNEKILKSNSNSSFYSKRTQSDMNKSRINFNFKEREMENKVKRILVGKKKTSPYVNK